MSLLLHQVCVKGFRADFTEQTSMHVCYFYLDFPSEQWSREETAWFQPVDTIDYFIPMKWYFRSHFVSLDWRWWLPWLALVSWGSSEFTIRLHCVYCFSSKGFEVALLLEMTLMKLHFITKRTKAKKFTFWWRIKEIWGSLFIYSCVQSASIGTVLSCVFLPLSLCWTQLNII